MTRPSDGFFVAASVRFWPEADPQATAAERPLLVKADVQIRRFLNICSERLVSIRKRTFE